MKPTTRSLSSSWSLSLACAACLSALLAGCQPPNPPPHSSPRLAHAYSQHTPAEMDAEWSFAITPQSCHAQASAKDLTLTIDAEDEGIVALTVAGAAISSLVSHPGPSAHLIFSGPGGTWTLMARTQPANSLSVRMPLNKTSASDVLSLLSGGRLEGRKAQRHSPALNLPDANVAGRDWFGCVRTKLTR